MTKTPNTETPEYQNIHVERHGDIAVVRFRNVSLAEDWVMKMGQEINQVIDEEGFRKIVICLGDIEVLFSVFLGKLVSIEKKLSAEGSWLKLCEVPPYIRQVFRDVQLDSYFTFCENVDAALQETSD